MDKMKQFGCWTLRIVPLSLLAALLAVEPAFPQRSSSVDSHMSSRMTAQLPSMSYTLSDSYVYGKVRETVENEDLSDKEKIEQNFAHPNPNLNWPAPPRVWLESSIVDFFSTSTSRGLQWAPNVFGVSLTTSMKMNYDFAYQVKSAFAIIAPAGVGRAQQLELNPDNLLLYLKTNEGVVGLCIHEPAFRIDDYNSVGAEWLGNGGSSRIGSSREIKSTYLSQFFQVDPSIPIKDYEEHCRLSFSQDLQKEVEANFSRQIVSFMFHNNPASTCSPHVNNQSLPGGDPECDVWFKRLDQKTRQRTVARCELASNGAHRCVLRTKQDRGNCPLYQTPSGLRTSPLTARDKLATAGPMDGWISYPCDSSQGYSCSIERRPFTLGGFMIFNNGVGRCVKINSGSRSSGPR